MIQFSYPYMTIGKTRVLIIRTFVSKVMSLLFNMLSRFVTTFLPRSKRLYISWLQSLSAVILEPREIRKSLTAGRFLTTEPSGKPPEEDVVIKLFFWIRIKLGLNKCIPCSIFEAPGFQVCILPLYCGSGWSVCSLNFCA